MKKHYLVALLVLNSLPINAALFHAYNFKDVAVEFKIKQGGPCDDAGVFSVPPITTTQGKPTSFGSDMFKRSFLTKTEECGVLHLVYRIPPSQNWLIVGSSDMQILNDLGRVNKTGSYLDGVFYIIIPKNDLPYVSHKAPE